MPDSSNSFVVNELHLWTVGDASVGITGESAIIKAPAGLVFAADHNESELKEILEEFRSKAVEAFRVIWPNDQVRARFDFELPEWD